MILLSHPTGNAFARAVLAGLNERGILESFHTTLSVNSSDWVVSAVPEGVRAELLRRKFDAPEDKIVCHPLKEWVRLVAQRLGWQFLTRHEQGWASVDAVYRDLDAAVARYLSGGHASLRGVYCYEDGALETFRKAKELGLKCIYDLPIAYWETSQRLLQEEAERLPDWEPTLVGTRDSKEKLDRKSAELALADAVVCPSDFVAGTLPESARKEKDCIVAEFGSPDLPPASKPAVDDSAARPMRLLFAGALTQRKGLADVMAAVKILNRDDVELVVMGSLLAPMDFYRRQLAHFTYEPSRPHAQVLELMTSCDAFVLPSIVEGRALVQQEAMMAGLPIIVTANAGGADLVEEGKTGFLVPMRAPEKLAEKIAWMADHRKEVRAMGGAAREKAARVTWQAYRNKILALVEGLTESTPP